MCEITIINKLISYKDKYINDYTLCYIFDIDDEFKIKKLLKRIGIKPTKIMGYQDMYEVREIFNSIDKIIKEVYYV